MKISMRSKSGLASSSVTKCIYGVALASLFVSTMASIAPAAPPKVSSVSPNPTQWIVNGSSLAEVTITFDQPVTVPTGSVSARKLIDVGGGDAGLQVVPVSINAVPDVPTTSFVVAFAPVNASRMTLVVDYLIANAAGEALDGEVSDPRNPTFPTGDNQQGGQVVLQFSVLQGEVSGPGGVRDGFVNATDSQALLAALNSCQGAGNFNPNADLNGDNCVNDLDLLIHQSGLGQFIPVTDAVAPGVTTVTGGDVPFTNDLLFVTFSEDVDPSTITRTSIHAVGVNGDLVIPTNVASAGNGTYLFTISGFGCPQIYSFTVSNGVGDGSGEILPAGSAQSEFTRNAIVDDETAPTIVCPIFTFVNSTVPQGIPANQIAGYAPLQAFLNGATASDDCSAVTITNSLDTTVQVPLGVTLVTFTARDAAENSATCQAPLIVVPAVPLPGTPGTNGTNGTNGTIGTNGAPGSPGPVGPQGVPGEDGENGEDGLDGADGQNGDDGAPGEPGPAGPQGEPGQVLIDNSSGSEQGVPDNGNDNTTDGGTAGGNQCGACGALGIINGGWILGGLMMLKLWNRRRPMSC